MTSLIDLWRAVDPEARRVSGALDAVRQPVRSVARSRAAAPHLPATADGDLLLVDAMLVADRPLDWLLGTLLEAELRPAGIVLAGVPAAMRFEAASDPVPVLASARAIGALADAMVSYLRDEAGYLQRLGAELRLATAEAALADPDPAAPSGMIAARMRRGVAVIADGELRALHPRSAGRALAARFAAAHARLLGGGARSESLRRTSDGLWLMERRIRPGASAWFFDYLPYARVDEVAADALGITLRALLRRAVAPRAAPRPRPRAAAVDALGAPDERIAATLLAVARANGRIAPAARALGVHRNTVLYRLRAVRAERGIDPRRPGDALRILSEASHRPS